MTFHRPLPLDDVLNPDQVEAVTHGEGPQLVIAGAGSGKTRVITYRVAWLVRECGVSPERIAAVTFTNKAAGEMKARIEELLGIFPLPTFVGTFHRFSLRLLRRWGERVGLRNDFAILDGSDQINLVKQALEAEGLSDQSFTPRSVLSTISSAKNQLKGPDELDRMAEGFIERKVAGVYRRYQGLLRAVSGVDFDDMIALAVKLLAEDEEIAQRVGQVIDHLLVDEYQDTNHAQFRLVELMARGASSLTAVGDEDQSIYRWRGADISNILSFEESFPGAVVRKMERNYRSTQNILDASGALVAHNESRRGKRLWTDAGAGHSIEIYKATDELDEARWVVTALEGMNSELPFTEMAILVRTNAQTRALEEELLRRGVPHTLVGGMRFYERAEIKDLVAYLRVLRNPLDTYSLHRIINQPPRGIGKTTLGMLTSRAGELGQPLWNVLQLGDLGGMPARSAKALTKFTDLIESLRAEAAELSLPKLLERLLEVTGYSDMYRSKSDDESAARLENIRELLSAAQEFTEQHAEPGSRVEDDGFGDAAEADSNLLTAFLDHASLTSDLDSWQTDQGISVMTLHSAKGLEFSAVVITGLEDGLLPHFNAQGGRDDLEEERRLLYVGMTRAKRRLLMSACRRRRIAGRYQDQDESPFLAEIPAQMLSVTESPSLFDQSSSSFGGRSGRGSRAGGVYSFFGRDGSAGQAGQRGRRDVVYEPEEQAARSGFKKGSRVRHATLGNGVVLGLEGSGDQMKITIFFDGAGKKKLLAKYAVLDRI